MTSFLLLAYTSTWVWLAPEALLSAPPGANYVAGVMVLTTGLFAGGAASFSWSRTAIWRQMPPTAFVEDFAATLRRTDKVQPALLLLALASTTAFAIDAGSHSRTWAILGGASLAVAFVGSVAVLVPLQRRITSSSPDHQTHVDDLLAQWSQGQAGRAALSIVAFTAVAIAALL